MVPLSRAQFTFRLVRPTAVPKDNPVVSFNFGRRTVSDYSARRIKSERDEGGEDDYGKKKTRLISIIYVIPAIFVPDPQK